MDTVLGLAVTPTNVQTVLVEGRDADGATIEHDDLEVFTDEVSTARASEQVAEAVLNIAEAGGHQLHAIGVTWSRDADLEASLVLDSLAQLGFANVVAVRLPDAAEALAGGIGRVIGYQRTAVCVVEPDTVVLSLVDAADGEVETLVENGVNSDDALVDWLAAVFARDTWRPDGLFVVGSVGGLDALAVQLEAELGLPVFDPPEAELAMAHGAALASALAPAGVRGSAATADARRVRMTGPITMLAAGAVAFVISVTLAVSPSLLPERQSTTAVQPAAEHKIAPPAVAPIAPPPAAPPVAEVAPPPAAPPVADDPAAVTPAEELAPAPEAPPGPDGQVPVFDPAPAAVDPPAAEPVYPPEQAPTPYVPPAGVAPDAPPAYIPPAVVPAAPPVYEQPRLRDRILSKIPGLNRLAN